MVSWWGKYSYFNDEQIQFSDVELMNAAYGPSGSFVSIVGSKFIGHNKFSGRRSNFCSKPTPIHGPVHKCDFNYSYSVSHFIWLPQAAAK